MEKLREIAYLYAISQRFGYIVGGAFVIESNMKYFQIYYDTLQHIEKLNCKQRGRLFTALYMYAASGEPVDLSDDPAVDMAFSFMSAQIERDSERYAKKQAAGKLGGAPKGNKNASKKTTENNQNKQNNQEKEEEKEDEKEDEKENKEEKDDSYISVVNSFNVICKSMPKVTKLTDTRKKLIKKAEKLLGGNSFEELFLKVENSDFLSGRNGRWTSCSFDWIMKQSNLIKIMEGNYDNKTEKSQNNIRNYNEEF